MIPTVVRVVFREYLYVESTRNVDPIELESVRALVVDVPVPIARVEFPIMELANVEILFASSCPFRIIFPVFPADPNVKLFPDAMTTVLFIVAAPFSVAVPVNVAA